MSRQRMLVANITVRNMMKLIKMKLFMDRLELTMFFNFF